MAPTTGAPSICFKLGSSVLASSRRSLSRPATARVCATSLVPSCSAPFSSSSPSSSSSSSSSSFSSSSPTIRSLHPSSSSSSFCSLHQTSSSSPLRSLRPSSLCSLRYSSPRRYSTTPASPHTTGAKDPNHPYLWYHRLPAHALTALSFLPCVPEYGSSTVLGYLPDVPGAGLDDLREEPRFLALLHQSIKEALQDGKGETVEFEAATRPGDGYIHITDERAVPPAGRIGETEDLIGSVFVQNGKVVPDTYEPFPSYRLVTSNGPLVLPRGLAEYLIEVLERVDRAEKAAHTGSA